MLAVVLTGTIIGVATLLLGGMRSRFMMSLLLLVVGVTLGHSAPEWFGLKIEPNASAILGAIVLGILGFAFYRIWVAICLGLIVAGLAAVILWFNLGIPRSFQAPAAEHGMSVLGYLRACWEHVPAIYTTSVPPVCAPVFLAGVVVGLLLNRFGTALFYSLLGASIMFLCLLFGEASGQMPAATYLLPELAELRVVLFAAFVLLGILVHMATMPRPRGAAARPQPKPEDDS